MINHWILVIPMEFLHFQNKAHLFQQDWDHLGCLLCQLGDPPDQSDCSQRHGWCRHQIRGPAPEINWYQLWIGEKSSKCYAQTLNIELPNCGIAKHISKKHIPLVVFCFRGQFDLFPSGSCHILPPSIIFHLPIGFLGLRLKPRTSIRKDPRSWNKREQSLGLRLAQGPLAVASCEATIFWRNCSHRDVRGSRRRKRYIACWRRERCLQAIARYPLVNI